MSDETRGPEELEELEAEEIAEEINGEELEEGAWDDPRPPEPPASIIDGPRPDHPRLGRVWDAAMSRAAAEEELEELAAAAELEEGDPSPGVDAIADPSSSGTGSIAPTSELEEPESSTEGEPYGIAGDRAAAPVALVRELHEALRADFAELERRVTTLEANLTPVAELAALALSKAENLEATAHSDELVNVRAAAAELQSRVAALEAHTGVLEA